MHDDRSFDPRLCDQGGFSSVGSGINMKLDREKVRFISMDLESLLFKNEPGIIGGG